MKRYRNFIIRILMLFGAVLIGVAVLDCNVKAEEKSPLIIIDGGKDASGLSDGSYYTAITFNEGDMITVQAEDGSAIHGLYIIWNSPVKEWVLETDNESITCGQNGFIHEYVELEAGTSKAVINIPDNGMSICDIRIFDSGDIPDNVQLWNAPCDRADIMLIAAHADDEILFFGGIIPTYGVAQEAKIQVVYMTQFWDTASIREHEKLDGLWTAGCRYYPVSAGFTDMYSESLEGARTQYDEDAMIEFIVEQIRRFKPQVTVTHDFNGEYGHGYHRLTADAVKNALETAADIESYTASVEQYGVWDTPKAYFHLYEENKLYLNLREPIEEMDGRTALEVAEEAYRMHVSQQWCWFYVSDDYKYSCADFGLYKTLVGTDTTNNMLENIKTYEVQEAESREQESIEESIAESIRQSEEESIRESEKESIRQSEEESISIEESISVEESISLEEAMEEERARRHTQQMMVVSIAIVFAVITMVFLLVCVHASKKNSGKNIGKPKRRKR
ncbi:MAG: PIG-L deacetylase family protein [Lachnospiraceae bacterium]